MKLNNAQFAQAQQAILNGFDRKSLQMMVRMQLGEDLDAIAGDDELDVMIFHLLTWAEREHRLEDLVQGALIANPANGELQKLAEDYRKWQEDTLPRLTPADPTPAKAQSKQTTAHGLKTGLLAAAILVAAASLLVIALQSFRLSSAPTATTDGSAAALPTTAPILATSEPITMVALGVVNTASLTSNLVINVSTTTVTDTSIGAGTVDDTTMGTGNLRVNDFAQTVTPFLLLRTSPGKDNKSPSDVIAVIPYTTTLKIIAGPTVIDQQRWWQVLVPDESVAKTGWLPEGNTNGTTPHLVFLDAGGERDADLLFGDNKRLNSCGRGRSITHPSNGGEVPHGYVRVDGSADTGYTDSYYLAYTELTGESAAPKFLTPSSMPKTAGVLGVFDTWDLLPGHYLLGLVTIEQSAQSDPNYLLCTITVSVTGDPLSKKQLQPVEAEAILPAGPNAESVTYDQPGPFAGIRFSWPYDQTYNYLLYEMRIFQTNGETEVDVVTERNITNPYLGLFLSQIMYPPPQIEQQLASLGLTETREFHWQVRYVDIAAPDVIRHGAWGQTGVFTVPEPEQHTE